MNRMLSVSCAALSLATLLVLSVFSARKSIAHSDSETVLGTYVNLLVVSVMVQDKMSAMPLTDLRGEDFEVFENGNPLRPIYFGHASNPALEPLSLWLVTECPMKSGEQNRSSSIARNAEFLKPALKRLHDQDTVGIAHWCGDKEEAKIDLAPTGDREAPVAALKKILQESPVEAVKSANGQSVEKILQLIRTSTPQGESRTLPIVVFFRANPALVSANDAERIARDVMSHTPALVFVMDEGVASISRVSLQVPLIRYLSQETGGQAFALRATTEAEAMERLVDGIQSRYLIGLLPPPTDGKWHTLKVQLSKGAIRKYGNALVGYRSGYEGFGRQPHYSVSEASAGSENVPDTSFSLDGQMSESKSEIPFAAEGATYEGQSHLAEFTLKLEGAPLSWISISDGKYRSRVTVVTMFLSAENEAIQRKTQRYEVVRGKTDGWTLPNQSIVISIFSEYPTDADHVRFLIRDDATGRIGSRDLPMQKVFDAPKLRLIIAKGWKMLPKPLG